MSTGMQELTAEILRADAERADYVAGIAPEVRARLRSFRISHDRMARELRARLARQESERRAAARQYHGRLTRADRARRAESAARKRELIQGVEERRADVRATIRRLNAERAREQRTWRHGTTEVRRARKARAAGRPGAGARTAGSSSAPGSRSGGGTSGRRPRARTSAAGTRGRAARIGSAITTAALTKELVRYVGGHPEGVQVADAAQHFGVAGVRVGGVLRRLADQGLVEKRGLRYHGRSK